MTNLEDVTENVGKEVPFEDVTELGQVMDNLDNDVIDDSTGMSKIDFNARLGRDEVRNIIAIDELNRLGIIPSIALTRQFKRLSVSLDGRGRQEKVEIVQGQREQQSSKGFLGGLFGSRKE